MVRHLGAPGAGLDLRGWVSRLAGSLEQATEALETGDAVEAERRARAAAGIARALQVLSELNAALPPAEPEEDVEEIRAELYARLARWIEAEPQDGVPGDADAAGSAGGAP